MKIFDIDELKADEIEGDEVPSEDELAAKISTFANEKLCDVIISNRYIGIYASLSIVAMKELASRREAGSLFNFESYIDSNLKKLPKLDFSFPTLNTIIDQLKGFHK